MPAADVVEKAKAEGLSIDSGLVYGVRSQAKAKSHSKGGAAKKAPSSASNVGAQPTRTKADFVRSYPKLTPAEVVAKAKEEGIPLEVGYVYNVRTSDNRAKKKGPAKAIAPKPVVAKESARPTVAVSHHAEGVLKAVAAEIGLARAVEILTEERARVRAVLGR
jgi:hypothetical protein